MLKLIEVPLSPYAQKVKLALIEKGIDFEAKTISFADDDRDREFDDTSPRREVPVLVDGEASVFDSTIILEYIEDRWPEPALLRGSPLERARQRKIEDVCDTTYEAVVWGAAEVRFFKRGKGELGDRLLERAGEQLAGLNAWLERELRGDWFGEGNLGYGDVAAFPNVNAAALSGWAPPEGSGLAAWLDRMRERPSVQRVQADVMAWFPQFRAQGDKMKRGLYRREYRDHRLEWMMRSGGVRVVLDGLEDGNIRFSYELE